MPADQLPKATENRGRARLNGQIMSVMIDIFSKLFCRAIAALRLLLQGFKQNRLHFAGQFTFQRGRCSFTAAADLEGRSLAAALVYNRAWASWLLLTNNTQQFM